MKVGDRIKRGSENSFDDIGNLGASDTTIACASRSATFYAKVTGSAL